MGVISVYFDVFFALLVGRFSHQRLFLFVGFSSTLAAVFFFIWMFFTQAEKLRLRITMATKTQGM